jgi:flagellar hook assembly protein FlgD
MGPPLGILENSAGGAKKALLGFSSNPFRNQVKIVCGIGSSAASAGLKIYDASGQLVRDLSSRLTGRIPAVTWNGQDDNGRSLPAGIYFLRLQTPTVTEVQKLILVR